MGSPTEVDWGGLTLVCNTVKVGATGPGQAGTELSGVELLFLDGVTAGTATASKAVVLGASKEIATITSATITTLTSTTVNATTVASAALTGTTTLTMTSANAAALAVGLAGATNPAFVVDSSTGSQAAGLKITGAATGGTVAIAAIDSGSNTNLTINGKGSGTIGIGSVSTGAVTITPALGVSAATTVTSASASALAVGLAGATNPSFVVDSSTGSQAAGLKVTGAATGGTVAIAAIDSGSNTNLTINGKGSGTIGIGSVSTGAVTITPALTVTGAITPTAGVAAAGGFAITPRGLHTGNQTVTQTTDGNDTTPSVTETYICEVYVPYNCTITGVALFNGSAVAGNVTVKLANSSGVPVGTQSASTAQSGTDAFQLIPLGATYAAVGPATYLVLVQFDNTGARFNTHIAGAFGASKKTGEVYGTFTTVTAPTTFTTALGPIASLY